MSIYDAIYRYIDENPEVCTNIKRFRGILLDLSMDDTTSVNLIELAMKQGLHYKISKYQRDNQREIQNLVTNFCKDYSINNSRIAWLTEFFTNIFAGRDLIEKGERGDSLRFKKKGKFLSLDTIASPKPVKDYIPCGYGKQDYGFYVKGMKEESMCVHSLASVYAVVFSILQRNLNLPVSKTILEYEEKYKEKLDYALVYRLEMGILLMIKNNYIKEDEVSLRYEGNLNDIQAAIADINHIAECVASLAGIKYKPLKFKYNKSGLFLSEKEGDGIITFNNATKRATECRYIWNERNIIYNINKSNEKYLDTLLEEIWGFASFLPGQKEVIKDILNKKNERAICVMPTGSGKSLIYYFVSMLNPCPTFVITPSEILIEDQIRNLKLFHGIDDVSVIYSGMDFNEFVPSNKFIYITPLSFMDRRLINRLITLNNKQIIGNVVLDEVHCISNWSHDFRPEYLMLSFNLNEFVDKTRYLGFTATANYTVIKDIKEQLNIEEENIFCPISMKNTATHYNYVACKDIEEEYKEVAKEISRCISDSVTELKRSMVFTRTKEESNNIKDELQENEKEYIDIYNGDMSSYIDFAEGETDILIADESIGIGINMPSITNTIHFGSPISKSEYIQEMGRAGRNNIKSSSYVAYISREQYTGDYKKLIDRNASIEDILRLLLREDIADEYKSLIRKIFGNIEDKLDFVRKVITLADSISKIDLQGALAFNVKNAKDYLETSTIMRYLYVLHKTGVIYSWYLEGINTKESIISFYIDQGKEKADLNRVKMSTLKYINSLGTYKKVAKQIKEAESINEVIMAYVEWHYSQLLYYYREQYIEMLDFLDIYKDKTDEEKSGALASYLSLSILDVQRDANKIEKLSIEEIIKFALSSPTMAVADNMRKSNENKYEAKLDLFLLLYNVFYFGDFDKTRYIRLLKNLTKKERDELVHNIYKFYDRLNIEDKLNMIDGMMPYISSGDILDTIYANTAKDEVYYYIFAIYANKAFEN